MIGFSLAYLVTFFSAMILLASAATAYEFRRMSKPQRPFNRLALPMAPGMSPARLRAGRG